MAQGFLSLFDDPVAGPQLALGALSTGIGLLTARKPRDINQALQGGISDLSNVLLYSGKQQALQQRRADKVAVRQAGLDRYNQLLGGGAAPVVGQQAEPPPAVPGTSTSPFINHPPMTAPMGTASGAPAGGGIGSLTPDQALQLAIEFPEMRPALMPIIRTYGQAPQLSELQQFQQKAEAFGLNPEQTETAGRRWIGAIPSAASESTATALEKYRNMQEERLNRSQALSDADRDAARANTQAYRSEKLKKVDKGPAPTDFERTMAEAELPLGDPRRVAAAKRKLGLIEDPKSLAPLPIERSLELEGIDPNSEEGKAAIRAARPRAGSADPIDKLVDDIAREGGGLPGDPLAEPVSPAIPETTLTEDVQNLIPTPGPESVPGANPALGGAAPPQPEAPPAPTLGEQEDVRLEKRLGAEKATALRTMLAGVTEPARQRQAQGILRRLAKGTLSIEGAAAELEAIGRR